MFSYSIPLSRQGFHKVLWESPVSEILFFFVFPSVCQESHIDP